MALVNCHSEERLVIVVCGRCYLKLDAVFPNLLQQKGSSG